MKNKKTYAFQYATGGNWDHEIYADTDLITVDEAKELWKKWLPDFIKKLQDGQRPEMVIWKDLDFLGDYREKLIYADKYAETDGKRIWNTKVEYIEL